MEDRSASEGDSVIGPHSTLPYEAVPVSKLEFGAIRCLAFDVRFGSEADIWVSVRDVRFTTKSGHGAYCTG